MAGRGKRAILGLMLLAGVAARADVSGNLSLEGRGFWQSPLDERQVDSSLSLSGEVEFYHEWDDGRQALTLTPFLRLDPHDPQRSHGDIREAFWLKVGDDWELRAGITKVYWGVTESVHLVDIVNQTDLVENPDGEQKLGQPMIQLSLERDWGTLDLFALPWFRERTFPGVHGRLRVQPRVDIHHADYESAAGPHHFDIALRWSRSIGDWDIGLAHFRGTSRDPLFVPRVVPGEEPVLTPYYPLINQTSLDVQATKGDWLWKLEAVHHSGGGQTYNAAVGGFEYTRVGILGGASDLGLLAEYQYDDRREQALTPFQNDLFIGIRWTANDEQSSELLAGIIQDLDGGGRLLNIEASRRLGEDWKLSLQLRAWFDVPRGSLLYPLNRDDYAEITLARYF